MSQYKVYQWATGVVGKSALRGILRHPKLELAGVKVYSEEKEGLDAGAIIGAEDTGVIARRDVDAVLSSDADCVIYCPLPWDPNDICQLLEIVVKRKLRRHKHRRVRVGLAPILQIAGFAHCAAGTHRRRWRRSERPGYCRRAPAPRRRR